MLRLEVVVLELEPIGPVLAAVLVLGPEFCIRLAKASAGTAIMKCCGFGDARLKVQSKKISQWTRTA